MYVLILGRLMRGPFGVWGVLAKWGWPGGSEARGITSAAIAWELGCCGVTAVRADGMRRRSGFACYSACVGRC